MHIPGKLNTVNLEQTSEQMFRYIERLYPICRSITGAGVRETLKIISEIIPMEIHEVPTGEKAFDWEVPDEWNIRGAFIENSKGERVIDFQNSNLHVLNYSIPIDKEVTFDELKEHIHTLPKYPDWIPYRTSYHNRQWGFCMTYRQFSGLDQNEKYHVVVDSDIKPGSLTYGEYLVKGKTIDEVLVSCHVCHPSLCNDNLSGIIVSAFLANFLSRLDLRFSYRFLFIPGTIGSIVWLSRNQDKVGNIKHGLVLTLLGDNGKFHYKKSRLGNSVIDKTVENLLKKSGRDFRIIDFYPYGYDERQFCSPGFNLPVGRLSRTPHGEFPEYHTSADNLSFIKKEKLGESFEFILNIFSRIESDEFYINLNPFCEPQLGKKGLYKQIGGQSNTHDFQMALLWVLNLCDGNHSLPDISDISGLEYATILDAANKLMKADLLKKISFE